MQGRSDPREVGERFLSLAQSERGRAAMYRTWVAESRTEPERQKWQHEAEKQEEAAEFHRQRAEMILESIHA